MRSSDRDLGQIAPRNAIRMLCVGLLLASLSLLVHGTLFPILLMGGCVVMTWTRWHPPLPRRVLHVFIFIAGIGGIFLLYGTLLGIKPGLSVLGVLVSLKILEAYRPRDFHILVLLGIFLCLTFLFFYQELYVMLYVIAVTLILLIALVLVTEGGTISIGKASGIIGLYFLQAIPLMVILFLLFPRNLVGIHFSLRNNQQGITGMSDQMAPGTIAALAGSDEVAFRVEFPDGNPPSPQNLYWRGNVLMQGNGFFWNAAHHYNPKKYQSAAAGDKILQRITLPPHGNEWLFALDRPVSHPSNSTLLAGEYLRSRRPISRTIRYEVTSQSINRERTLSPSVKRQALYVAEELRTPILMKLVASFREQTDMKTIAAILGYFQNNQFQYTLEPGTYGNNGLETFLFQRREGFCEHYAGAFATLARLAGIPARVVIGYQGGEFNKHGHYLIVRQAHAHAWCEVFIENEGWQRVDPTSVVAPGRIQSGSSALTGTSAVQEDLEGSANLQQSRWKTMFQDTRLIWDNLQYQWDSKVVDFGTEEQASLFELSGMIRPGRFSLLVICIIGIAVLIMSIGAFLYMKQRIPVHPIAEAYAELCEKMAKVGLNRTPYEGPIAFFNRSILQRPEIKEQLQTIFTLYVSLRYGKNATPSDFASLKNAIKKLKLPKRPSF